MGTAAPQDLITDTSTLVNFLRVGRVDLLAGLAAYRFLVTDHARGEVTGSYPTQLANFNFALLAGHLVEITLTDPAEFAIFAGLQALRLGAGECASAAAASHRGLPLVIDDIPARKKIAARYPTLRLINTVELMVDAIHAGLLSVAEADAIKADWQANHRFRLKFTSFGEVI